MTCEKTKSNWKRQLNLNACTKKCVKLYILRGHNSFKLDHKWWQSLDLNFIKRISSWYTKFQLNMSKHVREKFGKLCISSVLSSKRDKTDKNWRKLMTLVVDLKFIKRKSSTKIKFNMSKHAGEKCGKLHISYILSFDRGITPTKIDANWRRSNLIYSTVKQSHVQHFSSFMSKHVGEKCGKLGISSILSSKRDTTHCTPPKTSLQEWKLWHQRKYT